MYLIGMSKDCPHWTHVNLNIFATRIAAIKGENDHDENDEQKICVGIQNITSLALCSHLVVVRASLAFAKPVRCSAVVLPDF
jgi:hypothetical protein